MSEEDVEQPVQGDEENTEETPAENTEENQENTQPTDEGKGEGEVTSQPKTVELLGRQYDLSDKDQVQELAKDYDRLGRQYAPLLQQIRSLQAQVEQYQQGSQMNPQQVNAQNAQDPETVAYLRSLGFAPVNEITQQFQQTLAQKEEDSQLESELSRLENEYNGEDGRPKFNRGDVLAFCLQNGIPNPEIGYKILHENDLRQWYVKQSQTGHQAPPSSAGLGTTRGLPGKKTVIGPVNNPKEEVSLQDRIAQTLDNETPQV